MSRSHFSGWGQFRVEIVFENYDLCPENRGISKPENLHKKSTAIIISPKEVYKKWCNNDCKPIFILFQVLRLPSMTEIVYR